MGGEVIEALAKSGDGYAVVLMDRPDHDALQGRRLSIGSHGYAQMWVGGPSGVQVLHRWILGLTKGDGCIGDHINRNKLDNRRANLRAVTPSESSQNVSGRGSSRFRGVHPERSGRWSARVKFQGRHYLLGTFDTEEEAAAAADSKRCELMPAYVPAQAA
jgi:hypothetical protein